MQTYYQNTTLDKFLRQTKIRNGNVIYEDPAIRLKKRSNFSTAVKDIIFGDDEDSLPVVLEIDRGNPVNGYVLKKVWIQKDGMDIREADNYKSDITGYFSRFSPQAALMQYAKQR